MPNFVRLNEGHEGVTFHFLSCAVKAKQQNWDFLHIRDFVSLKKRQILNFFSGTLNKHWALFTKVSTILSNKVSKRHILTDGRKNENSRVDL